MRWAVAGLLLLGVLWSRHSCFSPRYRDMMGVIGVVRVRATSCWDGGPAQISFLELAGRLLQSGAVARSRGDEAPKDTATGRSRRVLVNSSPTAWLHPVSPAPPQPPPPTPPFCAIPKVALWLQRELKFYVYSTRSIRSAATTACKVSSAYYCLLNFPETAPIGLEAV